MKKYINICSIYILLWVLYNLQGILFGQGSIIAQGILMLLLMMSLYYFLYIIVKVRPLPPLLKSMNIFLFILCIYGVVNLFRLTPVYLSEGAILPIANHDYLKNLLISITPMYVFYYFTKKGWLNSKMVFWILPLYLIVTTLMYWNYNQSMLAKYAALGNIRTEITNNVGYVFAAIIPLLIFWRKNMIWQLVFMSYILYYVVMSMKRGAILTAIVLVLWLIYSLYRLLGRRQRIKLIVLVGIIATAGVFFIGNLMLSSDYFSYRVEQTMEGDTSNREDFYGILWHHWLEDTTFVEFFVGAGATETVNVVGNYAHNDWLELLINQGLMGVVLYLMYWWAFYRNWQQMKRNEELYAVMGGLFLSCILPSFFSMSYANMNMITTLMIGYCLACSQNKYQSLR